MTTQQNISRIFSIIASLAMILSYIHPSIVHAQSQDGDGLKRQVNVESGKISLIGPESGKPLSASQTLGPFARSDDSAMALDERFAPEFGLKDPAGNLSELTKEKENGRLIVKYQQESHGIPVLGSELIVNTNEQDQWEESKTPTQLTIILDTPDPSETFQSVNVSIALTGGTPTGTVDITGADVNCTITLPNDNCNVIFNTVGLEMIIASYNGDDNHFPAYDTEDHTILTPIPAANLVVTNTNDSGPGSLRVVSSSQPILTTIRLLYNTASFASYYEITGLPHPQLSTQYFFPWYNNTAMSSELRFAVP